MAFFKNLFNSGGDAKQDFSSKIPDRLLPKDFQVHQTFQHGFPYQPSCLAYDSVQKLLAIGSHSGTIVLIGQPGLECHFTQENDGLIVPVLQLQFFENKGLLVSRCGDNSLYLWNIRGREPVATHRLEFQKDQLCYIYIPYESDWLYAGVEEGNVYIINSTNLELSGYTIYWDKAVESGVRKSKPGAVLCIEECPVDDNKILISFNGGLISLWNLKNKTAEKRFKHSSSKSLGAILMSVSWNGSGKQFAGAYSDGTIGIFNIKNEGKPEKIIAPHGSLSTNSPIGKLRWFHTDPEPWKIFTGGYPELEGSGIRSLTLQTSQQTHLMTFKDPIVDFICLPSSPFPSDIQKTFAISILTQNELLLYDLQTTGVPNFNNPFCFDIHYSPVTSLVYCGNCPDDFIAQLHSVKSKLPHTPASTKQWPLRGGRWGDESPDPWTDLILTGHLDGTVRFWFCRSVVMQPLFTISTSCYFRSESSPTDHAPNRSPRPNRKTSSEQETIHEEPPTPATPTSAPPIPILSPPVPDVNIIEEPDSETTPISDAPTPSSEAPPLLGGTSSPNSVSRKSVISREKKSFLKKAFKSKKKKKGSESSDVEGGARGGAETPDDTESLDGMEDGSLPDEDPNKSPPKPKHLPLFTRKKSTDSLKAVSASDGGSVGRKSPDDYVVVSLINNVPCKKSEELAVHQSYFCPYSQNLSVANISGHVLVFDFSVTPTDHKPQTLLVNMSNDTVCFGDTLRDKKHERLSLALSFNEERDQLLPGFYVKQHVFMYTRSNDTLEPVDVTAIKYWEQSKLLAIGSETGLVIIDININQILHVLGNITSILYLADPGTYSKVIRKVSVPALHKAGSTSHKLFEKKLTTPLIIPSMELPHVDEGGGGATQHGGKIKVGRQHSVLPDDCLVTCVELVQFFLNKTVSSLITLWVATYSGNISVYSIKSAAFTRNGKSNIEIMPTGLVIERKSPVVQLHFLNEWGEQLVSPYKTTNDGVASVLKKRQIEKETNDAQKPVNYVVMVTKDSIRCVGFPGNQVINNIDITDSHHIVHSGLFTCDGLPCHLSLLSDGIILINTLPGLKSMIKYQSNYLHSSRALYTFRISGNGQALYQTTPSQFQRLSVTAHDNLNIPLSRPIMHQLLEGPTHNKGLLQMLVGVASPTSGDKKEIFGVEAAGKAWKSVATRHDLLAVKEKERETKGKRGGKGGGGGGASSTDGSGNAFTQARQKLDKRGEDLSRIEEQTEKLATDADDFASVAERLAEKYRKKRF